MREVTRARNIKAVVDTVALHQPNDVKTVAAAREQFCGTNILRLRSERRTDDDADGKQEFAECGMVH